MTSQIFFAIDPLAVATTALFMMAVATVWFSPLFLGPLYERSLGRSEPAFQSGRETLTALAGTLIAFLCIETLFAFALISAPIIGFSVRPLALGLAVLVLSVAAVPVIWERRPLMYYAVQAGFGLAFVAGSLFILQYWPW